MKKLIALILSVFGLFSCSLFSSVSDIDVHNNLVIKMDVVGTAEQAFYRSYISLKEGDDSADIIEKFTIFSTAVKDLDKYFEDTNFISYQEVFYQNYKEFYKDFILGYSSLSGDFVGELKSRGVTFDVISKYVNDLDQYSLNFVDLHNRLIDVINQQSDA